MARFQIETPEGKFEVEAPDEATAIQALGLAPPAQEQNVVGNTAMIALSGLGKGLEQGLNPLNWLSGAASLVGNRYVQAIFNPASAGQNFVINPQLEKLTGQPTPNPAEDLAQWAARNAPHTSPMRLIGPAVEAITGAPAGAATEAMDPRRVAERLGAEMTPLRRSIAGGLEIAGNIAPTMVFGGPAATLKTAAQAGTGAAIGDYVAGPRGRLFGALAAPLAPAALGAAARAAGRGVGAVRDLGAPFTKAGQQRIADKALLEAAGESPASLAAKMREAPLPGQPATLGQLTGNRGLLDAEYALHPKTPLLEDAYRKTAALAGEEMARMAPATERAASESIRAALDRARASAHARASGLWKPVDAALEGAKVSRAEFGAVMKPHFRSLSRAELDSIPGEIRSNISSLMETKRTIGDQSVTLKNFRLMELTGLRSSIASAAREAVRAGNDNRARVLNGLVAKIDEYMDRVGPTIAPTYAEARSGWRAFKRAFDKDPEIGALFAKNADGTFRVPASEIGGKLQRMSAEAVERLVRLPGVKDRVRDWLIAQWREKATTANASTRATGTPSFAGALKFRQDYDHIFKAALTRDELKRADKVVEALRMPTLPEYGQRRFGSPTLDKIEKGTALGGLIGRLIDRIPGVGMLNRTVGHAAYAGPTKEIHSRLARAMLNPGETLRRLESRARPIPKQSKWNPEFLRALLPAYEQRKEKRK